MTLRAERGSACGFSEGLVGELLEEIGRGNDKALAELYDQTSSRVFGLTLRILRDRGAAEEATLDVYRIVWEKAMQFHADKGTPSAWLLAIARNRAIDRLRALARSGGRHVELDEQSAGFDSRPDPEARAMSSERETRVRQALELLPYEERRAVEAAFFRGLSHAQVARQLGAPLGTVKTRIRSGLARLRKELAVSGRERT